VRSEFAACLQDLPEDAVADLADRIDHARSMRDLWHLRAEVYRAIGVHRSQTEAEIRLSRLNRHFPTRAPRPGLDTP
jgi:Tfp pilus assembly protein PilF